MAILYSSESKLIEIECDFCSPSTMDTMYVSWPEAFNEFRQRGWKFFKNELGDWQHKCPECVRGPSAKEDFT